MRSTFSLFLIILASSCIAQVNESDSVEVHSPKRATILSAVLPGAGQVYNKKYWKVPIIYGGLGLSIYYLDRNLGEIKFYRNEIKAMEDDDPNTNPTTEFGASQLNDILDQYKRLRDWSYISIGAIYALQILDASVDAHLFNFDVGEDLSLMILPSMDFTIRPTAGFLLALKF